MVTPTGRAVIQAPPTPAESAGESEAASLSANALLGSPESSESRSSRAESESESD